MCLSAWIGVELTENEFNVTERSFFDMGKKSVLWVFNGQNSDFFLDVGLFFPNTFISNA
jgi:hypothetical protein